MGLAGGRRRPGWARIWTIDIIGCPWARGREAGGRARVWPLARPIGQSDNRVAVTLTQTIWPRRVACSSAPRARLASGARAGRRPAGRRDPRVRRPGSSGPPGGGGGLRARAEGARKWHGARRAEWRVERVSESGRLGGLVAWWLGARRARRAGAGRVQCRPAGAPAAPSRPASWPEDRAAITGRHNG